MLKEPIGGSLGEGVSRPMAGRESENDGRGAIRVRGTATLTQYMFVEKEHAVHKANTIILPFFWTLDQGILEEGQTSTDETGGGRHETLRVKYICYPHVHCFSNKK